VDSPHAAVRRPGPRASGFPRGMCAAAANRNGTTASRPRIVASCPGAVDTWHKGLAVWPGSSASRPAPTAKWYERADTYPGTSTSCPDSTDDRGGLEGGWPRAKDACPGSRDNW